MELQLKDTLELYHILQHITRKDEPNKRKI